MDNFSETVNKTFQQLNSTYDGKLEPPNEVAVAKAQEVYGMLEKLQCLPDKVLASAEGGVALVFNRPGKYADIECFNSGEILYLTKTLDDKNLTVRRVQKMAEITDVVRWLHA